MSRKIIGFLAFIATGVGLLGGTFFNNNNTITIASILTISAFFIIGLIDHYKQLTK